MVRAQACELLNENKEKNSSSNFLRERKRERVKYNFNH